MTLPLVATKLHVPPERPGLVARPRLLARLARAVRGKLTLVSAPAGFGKTTLLASWLARHGDDHAVAWFSLDAADSDPTAFWTGVVTALRSALPGIGDRTAELLTTSPASMHLVLPALLNELSEAGEVCLVLDDYHLVDDRVAQEMAFLLEHLPPQAHVVLSTRADPNLPLARWRAGGELVEIRAVDLRFTSDETATYLGRATSRQLTTEQVQALEDRTEGWIVALQLAAISLDGHADVAGFIDGFAGDDRYVVDYLVEEVLAHQSASVRDFLLQSAVLDRLCGSLCDAVVGTDDAGGVLQAIDRANLFLVPLDNRREWYRYHQLFSDVLRARLLAERPDLVPVLHRRASQWHEEHDLTDSAIAHALASKDFDRAAFLVETVVPEVRRNRQESKVHGWLSALPDATVRRRPVLSVFSAAVSMVTGDLGAVGSRLDDAERALAAADEAHLWADTDELRTLPATIAIYRASMAQAQGDVAGTVRHARVALALAGPQDHLARGGAAGFLGLAAWADGDVSRALETFGNAVASLNAAGNHVDGLGGTVVLADLWRTSGRPARARELGALALTEAKALGERGTRATAELHVMLSELDTEAGDLEAAGRHLASADDLAGRAAVTESHFRYFVATGLLAAAEGDLADAVLQLDRAEQLHRPGFFPDVRPIPAIRARIRVRQGLLEPAFDWARERRVATNDPSEYLREFDHLTLVRLLLAEHRTHPEDGTVHELVGMLDRLREAAESSGRAGSLVEIHMLTALNHDAQGRRSQALGSLAETFAGALEPDAYVRLFLDEGEPMMGLLRAADQAKLASPHAHRLLAFAANHKAYRLGVRHGGGAPLTDPLSGRELQVLGLLESELSGPQIAAALFISANTLRTHTKHIFTKLGVTSRRAAVVRARQRGLTPGSD
ncbi:LuxR C-terminal-related transcriptional regulator [Knoellia locipacati]|uniref:LuxR C-terminal-related transcriptional regulator n=1 Tax=Knoellia locipacati TaxID=882824 RepID=UPI003850E1BC